MAEVIATERECRSVVESNIGPIPTRVIGRRDRLESDLALDTLDLWSIAMDLEARFRIRFTDPEVLGWATFGDLVDMVQAKLEAAHAAA